MLFNSLDYLFLFLPIVVLTINILKKYSVFFSKILLILFSVYFYSYFKIEYLPLILGSIIINYIIVSYFSKLNKNLIFLLCICINVIILGYFKYKNFFINNINFLFDLNYQTISFSFPLALSFITFQQIGFVVDVYNNNKRKINFLDYCLFIFFFPQLIAGPILKYEFFCNQIKYFYKKISYRFLCLGLMLISIGLFKKSFLSDNLGFYVDQNYSNISNLNLIELWITSYAWSFQFYFDFSGYIDLALGSALLFSIHLPINFNSPFMANNVIDFWQRWHITLGSFLTNYIFFPLSKLIQSVHDNSNILFLKFLFVIFIVFLISGIWHGPNYNFLIFGLLNGVGVMFNYCIKNYFNLSISKFWSIFFTFNYITLTFVFFRSASSEQAIFIITKMFDFSNFFEILNIFFNTINQFLINMSFKNWYNLIFKSYYFYLIFLMSISFYIIFFCKNSNQVKLKKNNIIRQIFFYIFVAIIGILSIKKNLPFLYFQF